MILEIEGKKYELEYDPQDPFISPELVVAYCSQLALDFMPILCDPRGYGSKPYPPEFLAYRFVLDPKKKRLCIIYEVYWRRQDCTWRELNKDHEHDYEQIQVHFNSETGMREKVVVSSVGSVEHAGHGVEVYSPIQEAEFRNVEYGTSPEGPYPWGGALGRKNASEMRIIPLEQLVSENGRPVVVVLNCYHVFTGLKRWVKPGERAEIKLRLERLDRELLEKWYYRHVQNRFGHDVSKPFEEPHIMYYPPPEDMLSRLVYGLLWLVAAIKRKIGF